MMLTSVLFTLQLMMVTALVNPSAVVPETRAIDCSVASHNKDCVIVGGGPIALAAALTLSRPPHSFTVTVLEQSAGTTSVAKYDPSRSYLYNINARGLDWFQEKNGLAPPEALNKLQRFGWAPPLGTMGELVVVPADPATPIQKLPLMGQGPMTNRSSYWIPRHQMVELLQECCIEQNEAGDSTFGRIEVIPMKKVTLIEPNADGVVSVQCQDGSVYTGALVVGADGIDSIVRRCLSNSVSSTTKSNNWLHSRSRSFQLRKYHSPATGLQLKALQIPSHFSVPNCTTKETEDWLVYVPKSTTSVALRGINTGPRNRLSLGMLPMKDPDMVRPANVIAPYDHEVWSLHSVVETKAWFRNAFPRLPWDEWVDDAEWARFVGANRTTFPLCQFSPGSAVASPDEMAGVVMVGDACHAFPPDIGQGINAGLQDVVALDSALRGGTASSTTTVQRLRRPLGVALQAYQTNRGPEHAALIRLARFGSPYQYRQPWRRHRVGRLVWTANVVLRMFLQKLSGGVIPPSAIVLMASNPQLSYRQVMRRADITAASLTCLVALALLRAVVRVLYPLFFK